GGMALGPLHIRAALAAGTGSIRLAFRFLDGRPVLRFSAQVQDDRLSARDVGPYERCTGVVSAEGISEGSCTGPAVPELLFETIAATDPAPPLRYCVGQPAAGPTGETWVLTRAGESVVAARAIGDTGETFRATSSNETFQLEDRIVARFEGNDVVITDGTSAPLRGTLGSCPPPPEIDGPAPTPDAAADAPSLDMANGGSSIDGAIDVPAGGPPDGTATAPACQMLGPAPTVPASFCGVKVDFSFETPDTADGVMGQGTVLQRQANCLGPAPCGKGMAVFSMDVSAADGNLVALHVPPPPNDNEKFLFAVMRFSDPKVRPKEVAAAPGPVMRARELGNGWVLYDAEVTPGSNVYNVIITMPGPFQGTLLIDELDWDQVPP